LNILYSGPRSTERATLNSRKTRIFSIYYHLILQMERRDLIIEAIEVES